MTSHNITYVNSIVQAFYLWPDDFVEPFKLLGDNLRQLNTIRVDADVFIDWSPKANALRIRSDTYKDLSKALEAVADVVKDAEARSEANEPLYIVEPPSVEGMRIAVTPVFKDIVQGFQPVIAKVVLAGRELNNCERQQWVKQRISIAVEQEILITKYVKDLLNRVALLKDGMKLRVHFGFFNIESYKKDFRDEKYSFQQFYKMLASKVKAKLIKE